MRGATDEGNANELKVSGAPAPDEASETTGLELSYLWKVGGKPSYLWVCYDRK